MIIEMTAGALAAQGFMDTIYAIVLKLMIR